MMILILTLGVLHLSYAGSIGLAVSPATPFEPEDLLTMISDFPNVSVVRINSETQNGDLPMSILSDVVLDYTYRKETSERLKESSGEGKVMGMFEGCESRKYRGNSQCKTQPKE